MTLIPDLHAMIERFNREVIGLPVPDEPTRLSVTRKAFALGALEEELAEFILAETIEDELDALLDLTYFALGRVVEMGVLPGPAFEAVHEANMRKQRGELSKRPGSLGHDAIKPEGWEPPDLTPFLTIRRSDVDALLFLDELAKEHPSTRPLGASLLAAQEADYGAYRPREPEENLLEYALDTAGITEASVNLASPKILVIGYARHGKDTVGEMLRDKWGLDFVSSSEFCAGHVITPAIDALWGAWSAAGGDPTMEPRVPRYDTSKDCFEDRVNHRPFWFDTISEYTAEDPARLAREIFADNDVYCGVRRKEELDAIKAQGLADLVVWVDRSDWLPPEDESSCTVTKEMADVVLDNNGDMENLLVGLRELMGQEFGMEAIK